VEQNLQIVDNQFHPIRYDEQWFNVAVHFLPVRITTATGTE